MWHRLSPSLYEITEYDNSVTNNSNNSYDNLD